MPLEPLSTPSETLTMQWDLKAAAVHASEGLKDRIDRRLRFALPRFDGRVDHVVVFLKSLNGPKGGIDKSVRILAHIDGVGVVAAMAACFFDWVTRPEGRFWFGTQRGYRPEVRAEGGP